MTNGVAISAEELEAKKKLALDFLAKSTGGTFTAAFKAAGIAYSTAYEWLDADPVWKKSMIEARAKADQQGGDFAESQLMLAIKDRNMTGIIFYLKSKHKDRGYVERQQIAGAGDGPIEMKHQMTAIDGALLALENAARKREGDT